MGGTLSYESNEDEGLLDQDTIEDPSQSVTKENSSIEKEPLQKPVLQSKEDKDMKTNDPLKYRML